MDNAQNKAAKDSKGNLNSSGLPPNAEANDVTKIKTSDQRKPTKKLTSMRRSNVSKIKVGGARL